MKPIIWIVLSLVVVFALVMMCQAPNRGGNPPVPAPAPAPRGSDLLPGEIIKGGMKVPIITDLTDVECSVKTDCPSRADDCQTKTFTVQKDTTYLLTAAFFNGDTLNASCRICATIYEPDTDGALKEVKHVVSGCPTGGPWVELTRLKPGITYTLSVCLQKCPEKTNCACGELFYSTAVISMRPVHTDFPFSLY